MRQFTIHGYPASLSERNEWSCNEALVEKFLRRECTGETVDASIALAGEQFPDVFKVVEQPVEQTAEQPAVA